MKQLSLVVAILGLAIRMYLVFHQQPVHAAQQLSQTHQTLDQLRRDAQGPDAEANAAAFAKTAPSTSASKAPAAPAPAASRPADNPARAEIETALKAVRLTTIMPGQPGLVIIDKNEYSEGEDLPLPKGRKARITAVQDDGVRLTCEGMAFRLDAPAGPDLAALRKKK